MNTNLVDTKKIEFRKIDPKEPDWFYRLRQAGWQNYNDLPLPDRTIHFWRYTPAESFLINGAENAMNALPISPNGKKPESELIDPEMAGKGFNQTDLLTYAFLQPNLQNTGIIFKELSSAIRDNAELLQPYFGKLIPADFGKFESANMALWSTGLFLYIPDNTIVEKPIYLHRHPTGTTTATRLLVIIGKNSDATILDDYCGSDSIEGETVNNAIEIFAGDSSTVKYVNIQRLVPTARIYTTQRTRVGRQAHSVSIFASLGGAVSKVNAGTILAERGGESQIYGVAFGDKNQHFDHHTFHHHSSAATLSNIDFKVVLKQKALSAYTGLIRIEHDAPNCEAYQENRNMLLNKGTRAESIPELEILNDQVRCTHGATVGQLDPEMVFYLKSRGFDTAEAIRTLVTGFVEPTINKMPNNLGHIIRELVKVKLEGNKSVE